MKPEEMWERFIARLEADQPLRSGDKHMNFLGSIESYRKLFMEANAGEVVLTHDYHQLLQAWVDGSGDKPDIVAQLVESLTDSDQWASMVADKPTPEEFFRRLSVALNLRIMIKEVFKC